MPTKSNNEDRQPENGAHAVPPSAVYSQPWWHGIGSNAMSAPTEHINGSARVGAVQAQANGGGRNKEINTSNALQSGLNGNNMQEHQHLKHVPSSTPQPTGEPLEPNPQMELVGHSIVLTSYPYSDPHYAGIMAYGTQVHPHLLGIHQTRMPLPLEMEEEPVYVNPRQYHGILRRRQIRAKLELQKKVVKNRKPYLHESRHQHAMRRARGSGGRFLNTKKLDNNATNPTSEKEMTSGTTVSTESGNSSGCEHLPVTSRQNSDQHKHPNFQSMQNTHTSLNGNMNGHGFLSMHHLQSTDSEDGEDWFDQAPHGSATTK
ncbi:hypothetical protein NMG60_11023386 [Bertholletia excelsa]